MKSLLRQQRRDAAIIVINKPPGLPVQRSVDELTSKYLRYDCKESPRLACRSKRILQKRYWVLVIGSLRRQQGLISVPLAKVVVDNGKSESITVVDNNHLSAQHALTEYRVIASSSSGYTWLELSPLTGRKHQFRVHCAEVLGTPIVGDYKYGWQVHKKLGHQLDSTSDLKRGNKTAKVKPDAFGLDLEAGSISDKRFSLHLHCKEIILPNISLALQHRNETSELDTAQESIKLDSPLPAHMQKSWGLLN